MKCETLECLCEERNITCYVLAIQTKEHFSYQKKTPRLCIIKLLSFYIGKQLIKWCDLLEIL